MNLKRINLILQIIWYYAVWFVCIFTAARGQAWLGASLAFFIICLQIYWQHIVLKDNLEFTYIAITLSLFGILVDSSLMLLGIIDFQANPFYPWFCPAWIMAIWVEFAIMNYSALQFLWNKPVLLGCLCFIFFPLAYLAGGALGAAQFPHGDYSSIVLGIIWGLAFPVLNLHFYRRLHDAKN